MRTTLPQKLMLSLFLMTACFGLSTLNMHGQTVEPTTPDVITLTWKGDAKWKWLNIAAASGETFTIDWGNETINYTGTGIETTYTQETHYGDDSEYTVTITAAAENVFTKFTLSGNNVLSLNVSGAPALTELNCYNNSLSTLDVSANTALTDLRCYRNSLSTLDVSTCTALTKLDCSINTLSTLDVSTNTALTELFCYDNTLSMLDLSANTALTYLDCSNNTLSTLDVSTNTALTKLFCYDNTLSTLDVSANTALTDLRCYSNSLSTLDVSTCTALTKLYCSNNTLNTLDVSTNTALTSLDCEDNSLSTLDVSTCTALTSLNCEDNSLNTLDVSANTALTYLNCSDNTLSTLDVSANTALTELRCYSNSLSMLDVSANTALTYLNCYINSLSMLDVSANTALTELRCYSNSLSTLDVSANTALTYLDCEDNSLPLVNLKALFDIGSIPEYSKYLGTQTLPIEVVEPYIAITIDSVFNGLNTVFDVTLDSIPATINTDYTITGGDITFLNTGVFQVSITHPDLVSDAEVIARFSVEGVLSDAVLATLTVSEGTLSPAFDSATTDYTVNVDHSIASLTITATANDVNATVAGTGMKDLSVGANIFDIVVTAEKGNQKTYTVTVTRDATPALSSDATLSALWVSTGTLMPVFMPSVTDYIVNVGYETEEIGIDATTNDLKASVEGTGIKSLIEGENRFSLTVTAEDGTLNLYNLVITREASPVGIENIDQDAIQIYPNPVTDYFRVKGITEPAVVSVYSLQGSVLLQRKVEADENIYIGNLSPGIYLIKVNGTTFKVPKR